MLKNIKWLFFDVGSTLMNETKAYEHRMRDMAEAVNKPSERRHPMCQRKAHGRKFQLRILQMEFSSPMGRRSVEAELE